MGVGQSNVGTKNFRLLWRLRRLVKPALVAMPMMASVATLAMWAHTRAIPLPSSQWYYQGTDRFRLRWGLELGAGDILVYHSRSYGCRTGLSISEWSFCGIRIGRSHYYNPRETDSWGIRIPLLLAAALLMAGPTVYLTLRYVRWYRRDQHGECRFCGYSLIGNVSKICPECGCATRLDKAGRRVGPTN